MASSDELAGAAFPPTSSSGGADVLDITEERSVPTIGVGGREGLRGLGEELVRLDVRHQRDRLHRRSYQYSWLRSDFNFVSVADCGLHDALRPYRDPALLECHGEQLLDLFIRFASKEEWKCWLHMSASIAVSMAATDILVRLFAAYEDPVDDKTLANLLGLVVEGGSAEVLAALIASGAGPKQERFMSATDVVLREGVRGLGEELVRLDIQNQRGGPNGTKYCYQWSHVVRNIVFVADSRLHDFLRPYDDAALLESHGEQLLDFVIHLASKEQWKAWLDISAGIAASVGATDVFTRLFAAYQDPMGNRTKAGHLMAAARGGSLDILSALIDVGAGPLLREADGVRAPCFALHEAAKSGHRTFVAKLIEAGASVDLRSMVGETALTEAVKKGHKGVVLDLLAAGADVNNVLDTNFYDRCCFSFENWKLNPLYIAIYNNKEEMVKILLEAGAETDVFPSHVLPLHTAVNRGHLESLNALLCAGISVGLVDHEGCSALHAACARNQHDAVNLLLRHNSNVASLCSSGKTPMNVVGTQVLELR